jgi:histidinol-phosphate aminotransferase
MFTFDQLGIKYVKPHANFVLVEFPDKKFVEKFVHRSLQHGVAIRNCGPFGLPNCVRISSGTEEQTEYAVNVFTKIYSELQKTHDFNYL